MKSLFRIIRTVKHIHIITLFLLIVSCIGRDQDEIKNEKVIFEQASKLTDIGEYERAIQLLSSVELSTVECRYLLAFSHLETKNYSEAILLFSELYNTTPEYRHTCFNLAQSYLERTNWLSAPKETIDSSYAIISILTKGIELKKNDIKPTILARYYANRGQLLQIHSNFQSAINDFNSAISLDPLGNYYSGRGMTYHFQGKDELACQDLKKGRELGQIYIDDKINKICR